MSFAPSTDVILLGLFGAAFTVYISSSFGLGKAEDDQDDAAKSFAISGLTASIIGMFAIWIFKHAMAIPTVSEGDGLLSKIYPFAMYLLPVTTGMATLSASSYGLGKYDKTRDSQEYTISLAFFSIGLAVSILTLGAWNAGNLAISQCAPVIASANKLKDKAGEYVDIAGALTIAKQKQDLNDIAIPIPNA